MSLKEHILKDVQSIESPHLLHQVFEYIQVIKHTESQIKPNHDIVMKFAGMLSDTEAKKLTALTDKEFNRIEGEW